MERTSDFSDDEGDSVQLPLDSSHSEKALDNFKSLKLSNSNNSSYLSKALSSSDGSAKRSRDQVSSSDESQTGTAIRSGSFKSRKRHDAVDMPATDTDSENSDREAVQRKMSQIQREKEDNKDVDDDDEGDIVVGKTSSKEKLVVSSSTNTRDRVADVSILVRTPSNNSLSPCNSTSFLATADSLSQNSTSTSLFSPISTKTAKEKSYLSGGVLNTGSLVGLDELQRYFPDRKLKIFVGTWNMGETRTIPANLAEFILPDHFEFLCDIYTIGTQESIANAAEWDIAIQQALGPSYVLLESASHGTLHLAIFIRRDLIWFCSPVEEDKVSTRPGSMIKTKGALGLAFTFFGASLLFVTSHLTSDEDKVQERISDYQKIAQDLQLPKAVPTTFYTQAHCEAIKKFDYVFWSGDLNFRLDIPREVVESKLKNLAQEKRPDYYHLIKKYDQLKKAMKSEGIFAGFEEWPINFPPTYKFDLDSDTYDTSPKNRIPSYTDRVLFKARKENTLAILSYDYCNGIKVSDHRPVYATAVIKIKPGKDDLPNSGGAFVRSVYVEANKRRSASLTRLRDQRKSSVCSLS